MIETLIKNANVRGYDGWVDIAINNGTIVDVTPTIKTAPKEIIDAGGKLVSAPFVDAHFHMDATLSLGLPRLNTSGTLLEGIQLWNELKPQLTVDAIKERALEYCHWAVGKGILAIRSHVDICDDRLLAVDALLDVKKQMAPYLDLQLVAFPQDGYFRDPTAMQNLNNALDKGVDVVGGIPHFERTMDEGAQSVKALMKIAADRGLMVDMHCDESDDPMSRHIETLSAQTIDHGMQGRVAGSHLTAMHSYDNYYFEKLKAVMADADMHVVTNPLINITLQGRMDTYPKRRGFTRVPELQAMGLTIAMAQDCVMDPWYSGGHADMFDVAHMGYHIAHMTAPHQIESCFDMITTQPAKIMGLQKYGIAKGNHADLIIFNATNPIDAIRKKAERLFVMRRGEIIAKTEPSTTHVHMFEENRTIDYELKR